MIPSLTQPLLDRRALAVGADDSAICANNVPDIGEKMGKVAWPAGQSHLNLQRWLESSKSLVELFLRASEQGSPSLASNKDLHADLDPWRLPESLEAPEPSEPRILVLQLQSM